MNVYNDIVTILQLLHRGGSTPGSRLVDFTLGSHPAITITTDVPTYCDSTADSAVEALGLVCGGVAKSMPSRLLARAKPKIPI